MLAAMAAAPLGHLYGQGSYEIQVYGSDLVDPGATMFELHNNFTFQGSKSVVDGMYPTEHQLHEQRPKKSRTASTIGSNWASMSSPARIRGSDGNG